MAVVIHDSVRGRTVLGTGTDLEAFESVAQQVLHALGLNVKRVPTGGIVCTYCDVDGKGLSGRVVVERFGTKKREDSDAPV